ncbi:hypothetical protein AGOEGFPJ_00013 [Human alphaherpesvirus 3]|nr:hypothetical protein IKGEJPOP_00014 [Human alphaherpesvirus 3]
MDKLYLVKVDPHGPPTQHTQQILRSKQRFYFTNSFVGVARKRSFHPNEKNHNP